MNRRVSWSDASPKQERAGFPCSASASPPLSNQEHASGDVIVSTDSPVTDATRTLARATSQTRSVRLRTEDQHAALPIRKSLASLLENEGEGRVIPI